MMRHAKIRQQLYDYVLHELPPAGRATVEDHLRECSSCSAEVERLTLALGLLKIPARLPSDELPPAYWERFASSVDAKIDQPGSRFGVLSFVENLGSFILLRRAGAATAMGALVVATIAFLLFPRQVPPVEPRKAEPTSPAAVVHTSGTDVRMDDYLRKSKVLLVGLSNLKPAEKGPIDLSAERDASRKLVHEARYLKQQRLDPRSSRLINDLDKILIEVANMKGNADRPKVEYIRGGIHQENLLFKIRMAENFYRTARYSGDGVGETDNDR